MIKDLISIIIPVYNRENLIEQTVFSILNQNYVNIECVIIDDISSDNTVNVLKKLAKLDNRVKYFIRPSNKRKGANSCRNLGFKFAKGEYVIWFDSDDLMTKESLNLRFQGLINTKYDFIIGMVDEFYSENIFEKNCDKTNKLENIEFNAANFITGKCWFHTSAPLFKKEFLLKFKYLFDEKLKYHDETEFFARILIANPNVTKINIVVTERRMHSISIKGKLSNLSYSDKLLFEMPGYLKLFNLFSKQKEKMSTDVRNLFSYLFKEWILEIQRNQFLKFLLLFKGIKLGLFDNKYSIIKLYIFKNFKYLKKW